MKILGIETSCDETGAAVIEATIKDKPVRLLSNVLATSLAKHAETGGIIPEIAAREQIKYILPVINRALTEGLGFEDMKAADTETQNKRETQKRKPDIDAIAVTYGPGLIGSLLVGVETAKTLALLWNVPIIPVNHMIGHIYANYVRVISNFSAQGGSAFGGQFPISNKAEDIPDFPAVALVVSGGHTDLVLLKDHGDLQVIGGTRDDAAGECFDKCARLIGYNYPGGPKIAKLAELGDAKRFRLPRPMLDSHDFDFSFSGLKTAFLNLTKYHFPILRTTETRIGWQQVVLEQEVSGEQKQVLYDLCASLEQAIIDTLVIKTVRALEKYNVHTLLISGGVAANTKLLATMKDKMKKLHMDITIHVPPASLCTDNAAMIAAAGFYNDEQVDWKKVTADPELYY